MRKIKEEMMRMFDNKLDDITVEIARIRHMVENDADKEDIIEQLGLLEEALA